MMNRNDRYANVKIKTYDELKAYFETALFFEADTQFESLVDEIRKIQFGQNRVWILFGCSEKNRWECLQVAQTKNILTELSSDIELMLSNNYTELIEKIPRDQRVHKSTTFYDDAYEIDLDKANKRDEKRKYLYSKMGEEYKHFKICFLKIDEYLGLCGFTYKNENIINMINIAKPLYAEAMLAYDMQARYWNMYNSGVDGQSIMVFFEEKRNQQNV